VKTGVSTAPALSRVRLDIPGFVGIAERGPANTPEMIDSWDRFEAIFGKTIDASFLGESVQGFFQNGGERCWVVRAVNPEVAVPAVQYLLGTDGKPVLQLLAASPGIWGRNIEVHIVHKRKPTAGEVIATPYQQFDLTVRDLSSGKHEVWRNLSLDEKAENYAAKVLFNNSSLVWAEKVWGRETVNPTGVLGFAQLGGPTEEIRSITRARLMGGSDGLQPAINLFTQYVQDEKTGGLNNPIASSVAAALALTPAVVSDTVNIFTKVFSQLVKILEGRGGQGWLPDHQSTKLPVLQIVWRGDNKADISQPAFMVVTPTSDNSFTLEFIEQTTGPELTASSFDGVKGKRLWFGEGLTLGRGGPNDIVHRLQDPDTGFDMVRARWLVPSEMQTQKMLDITAGHRLTAKKTSRVRDEAMPESHWYEFSPGLTPEYLTGRNTQTGALLQWGEITQSVQQTSSSADGSASLSNNGASSVVSNNDETAFSGNLVGLEQFRDIEEIGIIAIPDLMPKKPSVLDYDLRCDDPVVWAGFGQDSEERGLPPVTSLEHLATHQSYMLAHCDRNKFRFAILDAPTPEALEDNEPYGQFLQRYSGSLAKNLSTYGALYAPNVLVESYRGRSKEIPPSGYIAGIYAKNDKRAGVQRAPAGLEVEACHGVATALPESEVGAYMANGVNLLTLSPGYGVKVASARTLFRQIASDAKVLVAERMAGHADAAKHINVRRMAMLIEKSIMKQSRPLVFEGNSSALWDQLRGIAQEVLRSLWEGGGLEGRSRSEAYYVRCDATTNPPSQIANGQVVCLVGFRPVMATEIIEISVSVKPSVIVSAA